MEAEFFVPGRLCILGEHSDWASETKVYPGHAIVVPTNQGLYARASKQMDKFSFTSTLNDGSERHISIPMVADSLLKEAQSGSFFSYLAGVAYVICSRHPLPRGSGLKIHNYQTTLPTKKGLASSSAVCVLIARIFSKIFNLDFDNDYLMKIAYDGERLTGSLCGHLDQVCALRISALATFQGHDLQIQPLTPKIPFYFVVVDLCGSKDTKRILSSLNAAHRLNDSLQTFLGVTNKQLVQEAAKFMVEGKPKEFGEIMIRWQKLFDEIVAPHCPDQLTSPLLHSVLNSPKVSPHIFGSKGVGSQGDGSAQILAISEGAQDHVVQIITHDFKMKCLKLTLHCS